MHRGRLFGCCELHTGIVPFGRLIEQVMTQEPYAGQARVLDRGQRQLAPRAESSRAVRSPAANAPIVQLPFYASWLNQIEIVSSVTQRKVLTPNDFGNLQQVVDRLDAFEHRYNQIAEPFDWTFSRHDLERLIARVAQHEPRLRLAA